MNKIFSLPLTFSEKIEIEKNILFLKNILTQKKFMELSDKINFILKEKIDDKTKISRIRELLFSQRFPKYHELYKTFLKEKFYYKIPKEIKFIFPDFIEDNNYKTEISFNDTESLVKNIKKLNKFVSSKSFKKFFL